MGESGIVGDDGDFDDGYQQNIEYVLDSEDYKLFWVNINTLKNISWKNISVFTLKCSPESIDIKLNLLQVGFPNIYSKRKSYLRMLYVMYK